MGFLLQDDFDSHNLYALKFLQGILSVFAFAWLGAVWRRPGRDWMGSVVEELLSWSWRISAVLLGADGLAVVVASLRGGLEAGSTARWSLKLGGLGALMVFLGSGALLASQHRVSKVWGVTTKAVLALMAVGFLAWLPSWTAYGLNRLHMEVRLSPNEVAALRWVRQVSRPDALIATNHHAVEAFPGRKDRSYGYRVLADRPILLEGWEYGEKYDPRFAATRRDNDILFETTDADSARAVVRRYGIQYIVMAPDTDLKLHGPARWLSMGARFGSVKVYRIATASFSEPANHRPQ